MREQARELQGDDVAIKTTHFRSDLMRIVSHYDRKVLVLSGFIIKIMLIQK